MIDVHRLQDAMISAAKGLGIILLLAAWFGGCIIATAALAHFFGVGWAILSGIIFTFATLTAAIYYDP